MTRTERKNYEVLLDVVENVQGLESSEVDELTEFIKHKIDLIDQRNEREKQKREEKRAANAELTNAVYEFIVAANGEPVTAKDLVGGIQDITSTQKATNLVRTLVEDGKVIRNADGRHVVYTVGEK